MDADDWLQDWLAFTLVPGIGTATQRRLLRAFGSPAGALSAPRSSLAAVLTPAQLDSWGRGADRAGVERALQWLQGPDHHVLALGQEGYPQRLLESGDPPSLMYAIGDLSLLQRPGLAIVGSRHATPGGRRTASEFAACLGDAGLVTISGLALGIDAAAHEGGLEGGAGTIAVVGTGADLVYPSRNRDLARRIAADGLILSEFALGTRPAPGNFPRRNRIISGLSLGVLVVEAALQSGSLTTARFAGEQGREVFAIPGSIHSALSRGCHALIRQGAKLVESAQDVLEELGLAARAPTAPPGVRGDTDEGDPLLLAMGFDPCDPETLAQRTGQLLETVTARLLELELDGSVARLPGGLVQRQP